MNPGSPTPQAGILNQSIQQETSISTNPTLKAIRRPQPESVRYQAEIDKTIEKATIEGKRPNTIRGFRQHLRQLSRVSDLMNPDDVKKSIAYAKLSNSSKCSFALAYEWYTKANGLAWQKPRFKWQLLPQKIPTTSQVEKIISASTEKFATIFNLMKETGVEGEELHETHRNQYDKTQAILDIKGLKNHDSGRYKLKPYMSQMLEMYLLKYTKDYPFPQPKVMSQMWVTARNKAAQLHNDPELRKIQMKALRNYSGCQIYFASEKCPITVMRHMRHKKIETTMHYIRNIDLEGTPEYDTRIATTDEDVIRYNNAGYTFIQTLEGNKHVYRKRK